MRNKERNYISTNSKSPETKPSGSALPKMGYVMAVAASVVGLGNIWRFPYLCAKYGGGIFLVVYLIPPWRSAMLTMSETAIGRMTGRAPLCVQTVQQHELRRWMDGHCPVHHLPVLCRHRRLGRQYRSAIAPVRPRLWRWTDTSEGTPSNLQPERSYHRATRRLPGGVQNGVESPRIMCRSHRARGHRVHLFLHTSGARRYQRSSNIHNFMMNYRGDGQSFTHCRWPRVSCITWFLVDKNQIWKTPPRRSNSDTLIAVLAGL